MNTLEAARIETSTGDFLTLERVRLQGVLDGALFDATVIQNFHNPHDKHLEVVYTFPLPWAACLLGVQVQLGERHLEGLVVEKAQAEADYEDALADGNAAILLEENTDGSFTLNLGNLAPGERCTIRLRYAQVLPFEQQSLRLLIPTVIAPRFGDPVHDARLRPHQTIDHDLAVEYPFELHLRLLGELSHAAITCPSHPISVRPCGDDGSIVVGLARAARLDRDFILVLSELAHASLSVSGEDTVAGTVTSLVSFCPRLPERRPVAVKILVDCSGSMSGDSIEAARRALVAIVGQLELGDRFSLSRFGSSVEHRSRSLWRTTDATRLAAGRWAERLRADLGGTEMEAALLSTFALTCTTPKDGPVDVLLITDGEIHAIEQTLESARASGHRIFVVGAGSSPAEGLLRRLAEVTGGACDFVAPGEAVEPATLRMFARLRSHRLVDLRLEWPEGSSPTWGTAPPASVFDGDTVNVFAGFGTKVDGVARLIAQRNPDAPPEVIGEVSLGTVRDGDAISRMGAAKRFDALSEDRSAHTHAEALRLALAYQLVTARTNFLLVAERAESEKALDMPTLAKVKSMLPAGWGGVGSVLSSPNRVYEMASPYDVPAIIRCSSRSAGAAPRVGVYDIPAFLRKDSFGVDSALAESPDSHLTVTSEHYTGLTPLGVSEWLRRNPESVWPRTYAELLKLGLGAAVVDWLELTVGSIANEPTVVITFLTLLALPETHAALMKSQGRLAQLGALARRLGARTQRTATFDALFDMQWAASLAPLLSDLQGDRWPEFIFALDVPLPENIA